MFAEYITAALSKANYKILDNGEYIATVSGLQGVWATGRTIEGARTELVEVIEGWIALRLRLGCQFHTSLNDHGNCTYSNSLSW